MSVPARPMYVRLGVPYLAVPWTTVMVMLARDKSPAGALAFGIGATLVVAAWYALLYRVWRGGPAAIETMSLLVMGISGLMLLSALVFPVIIVVGARLIAFVLGIADLGWDPFSFLAMWWAVVGGNGLALVAGITMRKKVVWEWSAAHHPPRPVRDRRPGTGDRADESDPH